MFIDINTKYPPVSIERFLTVSKEFIVQKRWKFCLNMRSVGDTELSIDVDSKKVCLSKYYNMSLSTSEHLIQC